MFFHLYKNRLKVLLRNKMVLFWTLMFPIILGTLFNLAFSNLTSAEQFEPLKVAVVDNNNYQNDIYFKSMMEELSKSSEHQLFELELVNQETASVQLKENKIAGYITYDKNIQIVINKNGVDQTILKNVIDQYYQNVAVITRMMSENPNVNAMELIEALNLTEDFFANKDNSNTDLTVIYFFTLIGMVCMYGGMFGISAVNESEANLSTKGARISISKVHKLKSLIANMLGGLTILFLEALIILAYIIFVLKIDFGSRIAYIILIMFFGCLAGISLGTTIGVSNKKSENGKIGILIAVTMLCSFLSGMMATSIKYIIQTNAPILAKINPVNMITDGLYALYHYDTFTRFYFNVFSLIIFTVVMAIISYLFLRRKKYDSI